MLRGRRMGKGRDRRLKLVELSCGMVGEGRSGEDEDEGGTESMMYSRGDELMEVRVIASLLLDIELSSILSSRETEPRCSSSPRTEREKRSPELPGTQITS